MSENGCKYCTGVYRESSGQAGVVIHPRQRKIVCQAAEADMTGQMCVRTVEIPCRYCPNCGRKL